jgi:FkbM family methyltransferase
MKNIVYQLHYRLRRLVNYVLFKTVRIRLRKALGSHEPLLAYLNYSKAAIAFVQRQERDKILGTVAGLGADHVVLDVGGDTGTWAMELYQRYAAQMFVFEPNPRSVDILNNRFAGTTAKILPFGLGAANQTCQLSDDGMGSSVFDASRNYEVASKFDIKIRDVQEVFAELRLDHVDFIKINIEGGEYHLLPRLLEAGLISRCRIVRIQFHDWYPDAFALRRKIVKQLSKTHNVEWSYPMVWESWVRRESR